jgi:ATP-binding cassette subfamily F protein 3
MLKLSNISISFSGKNVFDDISFLLNDNEKLGLIGRNGCGKTTLLKIIAGKLSNYGGAVVTSKNYRVGYLEQHLNFIGNTIVDEVCLSLPECQRDNFWEAEKILANIGFSQSDLQKPPREFSGGWQIKLNLAKLLASEADLLLLDEPTNYLDIISIRWLRQFLREWKKSFILITHDRSFMDSVITHTLIIHRGESKKVTGNTQDMLEQIQKDEETYEKTRINEDKKRKQLELFVGRFRYKSTLASRVQSVVKKLEKQEKKEELSKIKSLDFEFNYKHTITNKPFFQIKNLTFGYEKDNILIRNFSLDIKVGDRICVIGKNGKGKSTLLKLLTGELKPNSGNIEINEKVSCGYFGQTNVDRLNSENTIEEELWELDKTFPRSKILAAAGNMMFGGEDSKKKIKYLSGGERSRVLLGKIILQPANVLLLDEPTNHLDMEGCISLMEAIESFRGSVITVTHNEDFLNNIATRLVVFDNSQVFLFDGGYQDFLKKIGWKEASAE